MKSYLVGYHYIGKVPASAHHGQSLGNTLGIFRSHDPAGAVAAAADGRPTDRDYAYWAVEVSEVATVVSFEERDHS